LGSGLAVDTRSPDSRTVILTKPKWNVGGVSCKLFSPMSTKRSANGACVRLCDGVSGAGYKFEREYIRDMRIPWSLEDQVP